MSPAGWILLFFLTIIVGAPIVAILMGEELEEPSDSNEPGEAEQEDDGDVETATSEPADDSDEQSGLDLEVEDDTTEDQTADTDERNHESEEAPGTSNDDYEQDTWNYTDRYETLILSDANESETLRALTKPEFDPEAQSKYNDRENPDPSSHKLKDAIEWLLGASTEAIHQQTQFNQFLQNLEAFIETPRASGAESVAEAQWRDKSPNLSRLIGERLLVMAMGLSAQGPFEMDAHKEAFIELLGDNWNDDGLEYPLLYQALGRMGLLTPTPYPDLQTQLVGQIPGRTPRSEDPDRLEAARYHSLLLAVAPGEHYPFPQSERGLSRLWHWDEHNPPLADWELLPPVLYTLWIHHNFHETESDAANDFGALLGNWWDENPPSPEMFEGLPVIWEALVLTGWVLLPGHRLIWNQIEERYEAMDFSDERLIEFTETVLDWLETYRDKGTRPPEAPGNEQMPPTEWIRPLPSDLINDFSQPSFDFPQPWCDQLGMFHESTREES